MGKNSKLKLRQRLVIGLTAVARFSTTGILGTVMAVYVGKEGSPFAVSMVYAAYFMGTTFFAPLWGALADVTGRKKLVVVVTSFLAVGALIPLIFFRGAWLPISLRGLYGVFAIGFTPVLLSVISGKGGKERRGRSAGFFNSSRAGGFTLGQFLAGFLLGILGPPQLYTAICGLALLSALGSLMIEKDDTGGKGSVSPKEIIREAKKRLFPKTGERKHLKKKGLGWLYFAMGLRHYTIRSIFSLLPVYYTSIIGFSEFTMGILLSLNTASQIVLMYLFGHVVDRTGRKPAIVAGIGGSVIYGLMIAGLKLIDFFPLQIAVAASSMILIAVAYSAMSIGIISFIGDVAPKEREGELQGLRSTSVGVAGILGPMTIGGFATYLGFSKAFVIISGFALVATVMAWVGVEESHSLEAK